MKVKIRFLIVVFLTAVSVCADPQPIPNGLWVQDQQTVKLEALTSMEELQKKLF